MRQIMIDTNAYRRLASGENKILEYISNSDVLYMSTVVLGELYAGFYGGSKSNWNIQLMHDFLETESVKILDITHGTARIFGEIKNELKQKGKMIPLNDIWIAAHAMETDSILVTYDGHFKNIIDLKLWDSTAQ
jgi:tRNA(fMet)-specific endonuclease VapC